MTKTIIFTEDSEINGVPIKKGTEKKVSGSIAQNKIDTKVAKEKKETKEKKEVDNGN